MRPPAQTVNRDQKPRPSALRFNDLVHAAYSPPDPVRANRRGAGPPTAAFLTDPRSQRFAGTIFNRRRSRWVQASRRTFLRGALRTAAASAAAGAAAMGPARVAAARSKQLAPSDQPYPYRIIDGCDPSYADHNCRPGCGAQPVCQDSRCCDADGWFRNEPLAGYKPLPSATCSVAGDAFQFGDGWLWEYRPEATGSIQDDPCRHCARLVFRCHDGMVLDPAAGVWQPQICRTEVECDPSGLPRAASADSAQFTEVTRGALEGAVDDGDGRLSVWGWVHIDWFPGPVEWRLELDDEVAGQGVAALPTPQVQGLHDSATCCHGFSAQLNDVAPGQHRLTLLAGYGDEWAPVTELVVATTSTSTTPAPSVLPQVLLPTVDTESAGTAPTGGLDALVAAAPGGAFASGWAHDREAGSSVLVVASVDGTDVAVTQPKLPRIATPNRLVPVTTVDRPQLGAPGWTLDIPFAADGSHRVCVSVVDPTDGARTLLGCRDVTSSSRILSSATINTQRSATPPEAVLDPDAAPILGAVESVRSLPGGRVRVSGWCGPDRSAAGADPTLSDGAVGDLETPLSVEVIIDGVGSAVGAVNEARPDLASGPGAESLGAGFTVDLEAPLGAHRLVVYGVDSRGRRGGVLGVLNHLNSHSSAR